MSQSAPTDPAPSPDLVPPGRGRRFARLAIMLGAVLLVMLPTVCVNRFFGRRPTFARDVPPAPAPDVSGLRGTLDHSAQRLLPTPANLAPDAIELTSPADRLDARADKVRRQAQTLGGAVTAGLPGPKERHLFVDLPAGRAEAFRQAVLGKAAAPSPSPSPAPAASVSPAAKDQDRVEVVIRAEDD